MNNNVLAKSAALTVEETEQTRKAKKAARAAVFGTSVEHYDFSVYGYVAATLATVFFPSADATTGLLNIFLLCASGLMGLIVISTVRKNAPAAGDDANTHQFS